MDLYGGGVGTGVDQGESAIRSGVGAADVGEGPILQNKVGGVRGGLADAACSPAIGNTSHLQPAAAERCGDRIGVGAREANDSRCSLGEADDVSPIADDGRGGGQGAAPARKSDVQGKRGIVR